MAWTLTAATKFLDDEAFFKEAERLYRQWKKAQLVTTAGELKAPEASLLRAMSYTSHGWRRQARERNYFLSRYMVLGRPYHRGMNDDSIWCWRNKVPRMLTSE